MPRLDAAPTFLTELFLGPRSIHDKPFIYLPAVFQIIAVALRESAPRFQNSTFRIACTLAVATLEVMVMQIHMMLVTALTQKMLQELVLELAPTPIGPQMDVLGFRTGRICFQHCL